MKYIFGFEQDDLIKLNISLEQALILKYVQYFSNRELTYKRILEDLKILNIQEKQLSRIILELAKSNLITKTKTKFGFVLNLGQKCPVLIEKKDKNVQSKMGQKCPLPIYINNTSYNIKLYIQYQCGTSNIINLINKWHEATQKNIFVLPNKNWNRIFDIDKLLTELKNCNIGYKLNFKSVVNNYDRIIAGEFRDFTKNNNPNLQISTHNYTKEMLNSLYDDLDSIEL